MGMDLGTVVFVLSQLGTPKHPLSLSREFWTLVSLLTCYRCTQLCPMDTIYIQAPSESIPSWPLQTVSTSLLHMAIPSKMFHVNVYNLCD